MAGYQQSFGPVSVMPSVMDVSDPNMFNSFDLKTIGTRMPVQDTHQSIDMFGQQAFQVPVHPQASLATTEYHRAQNMGMHIAAPNN